MKVDKTIEYYDQVAHLYDSLYQSSISKAEDYIVKQRLENIILPGQEVLDCGCGTGLARELLQERCIKYTGIDISSEMIGIASSKFPSSVFVTGDMADLSNFKCKSIDRIISINGSFSHVQNYKEAIREFERVLLPNGKLFLMVYNRFSIKRISRLKFKKNDQYIIRNDKENSSFRSSAMFWSRSLAIKELSVFKDVRVSGLNIYGDYLDKLLSPRVALSLLKFESKLPYFFQRFAHALMIEATK
ncbi:MAG: class I SAM-dependent methyltransferase [Lautropia sp.]|nr:class I SAM-dependent methyltransferase [Lautropia sp.]